MKFKIQTSLVTILAVVLLACGPSKIYTEIDFSFEDLEDVFPATFEKNARELVSQPRAIGALDLKAEKELHGVYGSVAYLMAQQCSSHCQLNWEILVDDLKKQKLAEYDREIVNNEKRFNYKSADGLVEGILWTNKSFLFKAEAANQETLKKFLGQAKIAKIQ